MSKYLRLLLLILFLFFFFCSYLLGRRHGCFFSLYPPVITGGYALHCLRKHSRHWLIDGDHCKILEIVFLFFSLSFSFSSSSYNSDIYTLSDFCYIWILFLVYK